jgi:hypothetical protein
MRRNLLSLVDRADRAGLSYFPGRTLDAERLSYSTNATACLDDEDRMLVVLELQRRGWR